MEMLQSDSLDVMSDEEICIKQRSPQFEYFVFVKKYAIQDIQAIFVWMKCFSFTILWPIHNVRMGDECTRDFLFGIGEDKQWSAKSTTWFHTPQEFFYPGI